MSFFTSVRYGFIRVRSVISKSNLPDLDYAFNPYIGCYHGCLYCYARDYVSPKYSDVRRYWGELIYVKINSIDLLRRELRRLRCGVIGVSTITDPYQPIEASLRIVREAVKLMINYGFHVSIQTKSDLILRDLDILTNYKRLIDVGVTITSLCKNSLMRYLEPKSPSPNRRAEVVSRLSSEGVETWVFYGPVIPTVNDDEETIKEVIELVVSTNSKLLIDKLRVRPWMKETLKKVLTNEEINTILKTASSRKWWNEVIRKTMKLCGKYRIKCIPTLAESKPTKTTKLTNYVNK